MRGAASDFEFHPLTPDRWTDLVKLFEHHGNPGYCWCMTWRMTSAEYQRLAAAGRKRALHTLVKAHVPIGILGYRDGEPVGWCSIAPRETEYAALQGAHIVESYPVEPGQSYQFMGSPSIFKAAGFAEVVRTENDRSIMRWTKRKERRVNH